MTTLSYLGRSKGFTLIELAVVLIIVIILMTLGIRVLNAQLENASLSDTRKKQDAIKDALAAYLGKNKRLPCPYVFGVSIPVGQGDSQRTPTAAPPSDCNSDVGIVPFLDLGLSRDFALDGWENFFTYRVTRPWTITTAATFAPGTRGAIPVSQGITGSRTNALPTGDTGAVAVIVSHGKNGLGALTRV